METTVKTAEITDVRGKVLKYLKIGKEPYTVIINIGEKTYNAVHALERAIEIPLTDNEVQADLMDMQQNDEINKPLQPATKKPKK